MIRRFVNENRIVRSLLVLALLTSVFAVPSRVLAQAQTAEPSAASAQSASQDESAKKSVGAESAKTTSEAAGKEEEEHANLKYSAMVQKLAKVTGLSVHRSYLLALWINFAIIAFHLGTLSASVPRSSHA